jgi:hypothetical protein
MVIEHRDRSFDRDLDLTGRGRRGPRARVDRAVPDQQQSSARRDTGPIRRTISSTDPAMWTYRQATRS